MSDFIVLNIHAHDRPGIMSRVSNVIAEHDGNWLDSRMARLGGQFAGIVRVELTSANSSALTEALTALSEEGIHVHVLEEGDLSDHPYSRCIQIDIHGNDRPGIVQQLTQAISSAGANIEELNTSMESAAMAGHPIFHAKGSVCMPEDVEDGALITIIENLSDDLTVEVAGI